jgi:hypothetical protein
LSLGILQYILIKCDDVSEKYTAIIFMLTETVQGNSNTMRWETCHLQYEVFDAIWLITDMKVLKREKYLS